MEPDAYLVNRTFEPAGPASFCFDRHYLLYAMRGTMRLEAHGKRWTLPPARAALIAANESVEITILSTLTTASVLFRPGFIQPPPQPLAVFEVSALARELLAECRQWNADAHLDDYARHILTTLASVAIRLSIDPSPSYLPAPKSSALRSAIALTENEAAGKPDFNRIAATVGYSPRTLARRFSKEMGMTWREVLRRIRIVRAIESLASTDRAVSEIAFDVGYDSLSAFNSAFRDLTGKSPGEYRASLNPDRS